MMLDFSVPQVVFFITLAATFFVSFLGKRHSKNVAGNSLSDHNLNRWLVGLSAGATANSGFVVTGAVGLGYTYGLQWVFLPIAWLLGDIVFWRMFPGRINDFGRESHATTLSEILTHKVHGRTAAILSVLCSLIIIVCLTGYTSAQWLAGQKFLAGAFSIPSLESLAIFALIIIAYTSIGGFRGSVYADSFQAVLRLIGTVIILASGIWIASGDSGLFHQNIANAGAAFMTPFPEGTIISVGGFLLGWAAAALGFGLGQPQLISRYLAGRSAQETQSAWWIYIGFVQFTWIAMTIFGMILRGIMPDIQEPEAGLSLFFKNNINGILTGIIVADIFATIAATSNSLLVAMSQTVVHDLIPKISRWKASQISLGITSIIIGALTMVCSLLIKGTVVSIALSSVSMMGAGLAPAVMIKVMRWHHTGVSLILTVFTGVASAVLWKLYGFSDTLNEAAIGIIAGLLANSILCFGRVKQGNAASNS